MSNELVQIESQDIKVYSDSDFDAVASSIAFLPRLQLMTSASEKCKNGSFPINNYALIEGSEYLDLGKNVDVLVLSWRPFALSYGGDEPISAYNPNEAVFQDIVERSKQSDSECMYGPQFLVYIPEVKKYASVLLASVTARQQGDGFKSRMYKAATLTAQEIKSKKYTYWSYLIKDCSTPFDVPTKDELVVEIKKFTDTPDVSVETVEPTDDDEREM